MMTMASIRGGSFSGSCSSFSSALSCSGPGLYEFLMEAELQQYYSGLKNSLKVVTVSQIKYVEDDDLIQLGMTKPEIRRLKKFFHKYYPQTYLRKIKQMILPKKDALGRPDVHIVESSSDRLTFKPTNKHIISAESITVNKELGVGEFGVVQQGVWTNEEGERIQVAIKRLSSERMQNNTSDFLKEAVIMHNIDHKHIVRLYGVVFDTNALMLVTELAPLRSLLECLKEPALRLSFPVMSLCEFALQVCEGMQYLESKRLIHRDLAARNILVYAKNKVKISDFGLSRALGVGKDYYQTNFNVNLKLPIAWCAPECINYLRFTSASDVWAFGVTLWEMFSYGFQPWAALTGQQILEAIDEPNFQRLEQPDSCPKEYYALMLKCWQHDPQKRPKFSEIIVSLPDCKPEQVQAIKDHDESGSGSSKLRREQLIYRVGDIVTVLDKRPLADNSNIWKGVTHSGKTGLFDPVDTVAYLGTDIPSMKPNFVRGDSKSSLYSSKRRLRTDMISRPQDDFKHTGHVGLDGAFFGDISFLGDKYIQLPKQIVNPYKPQDDHEPGSSLVRTVSDVSDRAPLLSKALDCSGRQSAESWTDGLSEKSKDAAASASGKSSIAVPPPALAPLITDHEYHEISDEDCGPVESPRFEQFFQKCLDFGPSLMDEVFKALGSTSHEDPLSDPSTDETHNTRNEIKELTSRDTGTCKKKCSVKPISASDEKVLDSAIAMANELACRSMSEDPLDNDSPKTPSSPSKKIFSFRIPGKNTSPKSEKKTFTDEAASIPTIQESITDEAKEAYNSLVEKSGGSGPHCQEQEEVPEETNPLRMLRLGIPVRPKVRGNKHGGLGRSTSTHDPHNNGHGHHHHNASSSNNSHQLHSKSVIGNSHFPSLSSAAVSSRHTVSSGYSVPSNQSVSMENIMQTQVVQTQNGSVVYTLPRVTASVLKSVENASPAGAAVTATTSNGTHDWTSVSHTTSNCSLTNNNGNIAENNLHGGSSSVFDSEPASPSDPGNLLPLPPRDRTKIIQPNKPRQRKHPLIIPTNTTNSVKQLASPALSVSLPDVTPGNAASEDAQVNTSASQSPDEQPPLLSPLSPISLKVASSPVTLDESSSSSVEAASVNGVDSPRASCALQGPPKPPRHSSLDCSFDDQIQADIDGLDDIPEEEAPMPPIYKNSDHVSCEDLLDFACDIPNSKRTRGRARGINSDEVRIMQKVLSSEVTPEECVTALDETEWDVHKAIKYLKLQLMLNHQLVSTGSCKQTLMSCNWDVQNAFCYLQATFGLAEDSTEV